MMEIVFDSPQPPKDLSEDEGEKEDFFPNDPENVNYVVHLNDTTFDRFVGENFRSPILAMFYAPCKDIYTWISSILTTRFSL